MEPVHLPNHHGTSFLKVLVFIVFILLIAALSSLGTYLYISNQIRQQSTQQGQQVYQPSPTVIPTQVVVQSGSPAVDETTNIENLVKDFYKKWIPSGSAPPANLTSKADQLKSEGYLTPNAVSSINTTQGYDLATCSQNPLNPEDYTYSTPVINGDKATMTVSGTYSGENTTMTIKLDLLKSGAKWMIDNFHCPSLSQ